MATFLYRIGKNAYRHWPRFMAGWLVALIAVGTVAALFSKPANDSFSIPGIPSEQAADLQAELFPASEDAFDQVVHLFQLQVGLLERLAAGDDLLALVVLDHCAARCG